MDASQGQEILPLSKKKGLRAQLTSSAMGVGGLNLISIPIGLAISIILARFLGPAGFGQYAFIISVVSVLSLPFDAGIRQLVTREVAAYQHEAKWTLFRGIFRRTQQWILLGSFLITIIIFAFATLRASWRVDDRWTLLLICVLLLPFLGLNALRSATLQGLGHVIQAQFPDLLVHPSLQLIVIVFLLTLGLLNPASAIISLIIATGITLLFGFILLYRQWPPEARTVQPDYRDIKWARAWIPFTLLMAANVLNNQIGILFLGWIGTDEHVAAFRVAERGAQFVALSLVIVNLVIAPHITATYLEGNRTRLQQLSRQSARAALAFALPVAIPLIVFGNPIVSLIFGIEYIELTVKPLAILAVAQLINVACGSVGMFLVMCGFEQDTLHSQVIALGVNSMAAILLIPQYGTLGAAYASAIGLITWNFILCIKFTQRLKLRPTAL